MSQVIIDPRPDHSDVYWKAEAEDPQPVHQGGYMQSRSTASIDLVDQFIGKSLKEYRAYDDGPGTKSAQWVASHLLGKVACCSKAYSATWASARPLVAHVLHSRPKTVRIANVKVLTG